MECKYFNQSFYEQKPKLLDILLWCESEWKSWGWWVSEGMEGTTFFVGGHFLFLVLWGCWLEVVGGAGWCVTSKDESTKNTTTWKTCTPRLKENHSFFHLLRWACVCVGVVGSCASFSSWCAPFHLAGVQLDLNKKFTTRTGACRTQQACGSAYLL